MYNEEENFQVEILDQTIVVYKATMESGNISFHDKIEIHEIHNIFTLSKVTKKELEQLTKENS
jgi:predicted RNA-binding protein (virulence factor B family)